MTTAPANRRYTLHDGEQEVCSLYLKHTSSWPDESDSDEETVDADMDEHVVLTPDEHVLAAVIERLQSLLAETSQCEQARLSFGAMYEDDSQWFTRLCQQLPDESIYVNNLGLHADSTAPLHLLMRKLAPCNTVLTLTLDARYMPPPLVDQLNMLRQLSGSLNAMRYVKIDIHGDFEDRREQFKALLANASLYTLSIDDGRIWFDDEHVCHSYEFNRWQSLLPDLTAAKPSSLRLSLHDHQLMHSLLRAVSGSLRWLELDIKFRLDDTSLQTLLQALQLPHLTSLHLSTGVQLTRLPVQRRPLSMVAQLLELASNCSPLPLEDVEFSFSSDLMLSDHDQCGSDNVLKQVTAAVANLMASLQDGSVRVNGQSVYTNSWAYQQLFEKVPGIIRSNRTAVRAEVQRIAQHLCMPNIAAEILDYIEWCPFI